MGRGIIGQTPSAIPLTNIPLTSRFFRKIGGPGILWEMHDFFLQWYKTTRTALCQDQASPTGFQPSTLPGKRRSQGNVWQGNGRRRFPKDSPDSHSPDFSPAFLILPLPSSSFALAAALPRWEIRGSILCLNLDRIRDWADWIHSWRDLRWKGFWRDRIIINYPILSKCIKFKKTVAKDSQ